MNFVLYIGAGVCYVCFCFMVDWFVFRRLTVVYVGVGFLVVLVFLFYEFAGDLRRVGVLQA